MKKITYFLLFISVVLIFCACGKEALPPETQPSAPDFSTLTFAKKRVLLCEASDGIGASFALNKDLEATAFEGTVYTFESAVPSEERLACIDATNTLLDRIGAGNNIQINIYTKQTYDADFVQNGAVYTHVQDWKSPEYTRQVLYALFGEYANHGLIRGYAAYLSSELYPITCSLLEDGAALPKDLDVLDLNLLCFREGYVSAEQIAVADEISNTFVVEYISANGETKLHKLIQSSADLETIPQFTDALENFYLSRSVSYTPSNLLFRQGGKGYAYIVKNPYCEMYIENGWYDAAKELCPYTYDGFLLMNLADTMQFFTINTRQMGQYQELFGLDDYNNDLRVFFLTKEHYHGVTDSTYNAGPHAIALQATSSFMHEYIHSLTYEKVIKENWAIEGSARHYSYYYDYYANAMSDQDYKQIMDQQIFQYLKEFRDNLGRDIQADTDFREVHHLTVYAFEHDDPNDGGGYAPGASFIAYLISRFGEKTVVEILFNTHDFGEYAYEELVADWQTFIQETYREYTKSK